MDLANDPPLAAPPSGIRPPGARASFALHERPEGRVWLIRPRPDGAAFAEWEHRAAEAMLAHGLRDWAFGFGHGKRTLGTTRVRAGARHGTVRLSRHLILAASGPATAPRPLRTDGSEPSASPAMVEDTLRHEIAHAVAYLRHGREAMNHGPLWRAVAREVGAHPSATCRAAPLAPAPWTMICLRCGRTVPLYRRPKHPSSAYRHKRCGGAMRLQPGPARFASSRARR